MAALVGYAERVTDARAGHLSRLRLWRRNIAVGLIRNALIGALVVLIFAVLVLRDEPVRYDDGDPRYAVIVKQLSEIRHAFARGDYRRTEVDLASLNDGVWASACVFGGYNDPLREMIELGATVSPTDEHRLQGLGD